MLSFSLSVAAIELTLKWNKVGGIMSLASTGQYLALVVGLTSLISVSWRLLQQEGVSTLSHQSNFQLNKDCQIRRHDRRIRQRISQSVLADDIEFETFSNSLENAISHALAQPDEEFVTNGGAFPVVENENEINVGNYFMSGALNGSFDAETQD